MSRRGPAGSSVPLWPFIPDSGRSQHLASPVRTTLELPADRSHGCSNATCTRREGRRTLVAWSGLSRTSVRVAPSAAARAQTHPFDKRSRPAVSTNRVERIHSEPLRTRERRPTRTVPSTLSAGMLGTGKRRRAADIYGAAPVPAVSDLPLAELRLLPPVVAKRAR